ncbi:MAG: VWA domain-containing protein [Spirochaetaceae bacterium]|jgi:uncharacterized protein YegL|nr:VWA domain-containing protein [Spirochaetaceae bacterium]
MKDSLTEIVAILDKSGSMAHLTADTIGGYNTFIKAQQELPGEAVLSTVLFSTGKENVLHNRAALAGIQPITEKEYRAGGGTALLDAMGRAIDHIGKELDKTPEDEKPGKVIFFVITDGQENSSTEYSYKQIKDMVERQTNIYKWEFIFMGANIDAFSTAESMGILRDHAFNYKAKSANIMALHSALGEAVENIRRHKNIDIGKPFRQKMARANEEDGEKARK